jgi:hypothetical protein
MVENEILVFDTGPLSHFARQNWLGVLKAIVGDRRALIPDVVVDELCAGPVATDVFRPFSRPTGSSIENCAVPTRSSLSRNSRRSW